LIAVLIESKIRKNENKQEKAEFVRLLTKVEAIASLHRHLYVANNSNSIDLKEYLKDIKNNFNELISEENVFLNIVVNKIVIDSDTALFLGLLTTELFINSLKHAFSIDQQKNISLTIDLIDNKMFFNYLDNGENCKHKVLKPMLIEQLCMQLGVQHTINTENGFQFNFEKTL
jgi:two-component sensor histidine kinase